MAYECIRIERSRDGYEVRLTDPELVKKNEARSKDKDGISQGPWVDPSVEYEFKTKEQLLTFLENAVDIALPKEETYASSFDKLAKEAQNDG